MVNLEELRQRAESALSVINENPLGRPVIIEFSGTPKSGKSTCIDIVSHFFVGCTIGYFLRVKGHREELHIT